MIEITYEIGGVRYQIPFKTAKFAKKWIRCALIPRGAKILSITQ